MVSDYRDDANKEYKFYTLPLPKIELDMDKFGIHLEQFTATLLSYKSARCRRMASRKVCTVMRSNCFLQGIKLWAISVFRSDRTCRWTF